MAKTDVMNRRDMMNRTLALSALAAAQIGWPGWMPRLAFADTNRGPRGDVLVIVFLRGGADGLNVVVPHGDKSYYDARPAIGIARPDDSKADSDKKSLDLDGMFGLHPALAPLLPLFKANQMIAVHATGSPDPTRSHFDAMDFMERGTPGDHSVATGWLGRHLASLDTGTNAPLRAIGWGGSLQTSLRGSVSATALQSILDYHLKGRPDMAAQMLATLNGLYAADSATLKQLADQTNAVLDLVTKVNVASYKAAGGATYDSKNAFDLALMQTAALIKADVGLEAAAIDLGGWDTHQNETADLAKDLTGLAAGLNAFHTDMDDLMKSTTVVIMSEFGRRVQENASGGTDHGHGNMMMLMGAHLVSKPVFADWPGLAPDKLSNGDLAITIDYRDVLAEVVQNRLNNPALDVVFPNYKPTLRGIVTK
ncbi:MAG TPA: DUF1501 domain-containing protein [Aggregatilineales bacterium]|nr:DUF1501 domain-containing protein [Aggregatilineales bacterium]